MGGVDFAGKGRLYYRYYCDYHHHLVVVVIDGLKGKKLKKTWTKMKMNFTKRILHLALNTNRLICFVILAFH